MKIRVINPGTFDAYLDFSKVFDVKEIWSRVKNDFTKWILTNNEAIDIVLYSSVLELFKVFFDNYSLNNYISNNELQIMQKKFKEYSKEYDRLYEDMEENPDNYDEEKDALPYLNPTLEENIIQSLFETYNSSLTPLCKRIFETHSKVTTLDVYGNKIPNNFAKKIIRSCYNDLRNYIHSLPDTNFVIDPDWFTSLPQFANVSLTNDEKETITLYAEKFCGKVFESYLDKKRLNNKKDKFDNVIYQKLNNYIEKHLNELFLSIKLRKDNNNMYQQSWITANGELPSLNCEEPYIYDMCFENRDKILSFLNLKLDNEQFRTLISHYVNYINPDLVKKIYDLISAKNSGLKRLRANEILNWNDDDKIGVKNSVSIDFDITNDYVRSRPIIIINDENTKKDYVFFGKKGTSHGDYIQNQLNIDVAKLKISPDPQRMSYGYLLGNIAFVDEQGDNFQVGYTLEETVRALKNDPRIKKVYTTPGHPHPNPGQPAPITRLAKLIFYR